MAHLHGVYDSDMHFTINPTTRVVTNTTGKSKLVQFDHNSERFTFEIPRFVEDHDMTLCDKVEIHYINVSADNKEKSEDVYLVDDIQASPADDSVAIFSWLISGNATKYEGTLNFLVRFICMDGIKIEYAWHTGIFSSITVSKGMNNGEAVIEDYSDILEAWRQEVLFGANGAMTEIESAKKKMLNEIELAAEIVQTTGDSETAVMSQKAVSDNLYIASLTRGDINAANDLNSVIQHGVYGFSSSSVPVNAPFTGAGGTLVVHKGNLSKTKPLYTIQIIYSVVGIYYRIGSSKGFTEWTRLDNEPTNANLSKKKNILFTEFERIACWWDVNGGCSDHPEYDHSQMIPVNGGATYYVGNKTSAAEDCVGAFFNANGEWIAPLTTADLTEHIYKYPDGTGHYPSGNVTYAPIYQFTAPVNACYFSYNLRNTTSVRYKQFVSSKPILALSDTGNYAFDDDYPAYQATKDNNLCVIGASTVMIDRLYREVKSGTWQHIVGFQEYLVPWYKSVESYGFTSGSWRKNDGATNLSIYNGIITNAVDLSGYDEFLLRHSNSGFTANKIGDAFTSDPDTYIGGIKSVIEYIYAASPTAKIYVSGIPLDEEYYTDTDRKALVDTATDHLKALCAIKGCHYIDMTDCQHYNKDLLTYDGKHNNHEGSKREGLFYRKILVGI